MENEEEKLKDVLYRRECPSTMDLGEYQLKLLDLFQHNQIATHLKRCPRCGEDLAALQAYMNLPLTEETPAAAEHEKKRPLLEELWVYIIDLLSPPGGTELTMAAQPAMRGEVLGLSTRVFHIEPYVISLSAIRETAVWQQQQIIGDILPTNDDVDILQHWTAYLWRAGALLATAVVDEERHFSFDDIAIDQEYHDLILSGPQVEIHLQNLRMA